MKNVSCFLIAGMLLVSMSSCLSLLKADRLVYAGSIGKRVDAVLVDSISKIDLNQENK